VRLSKPVEVIDNNKVILPFSVHYKSEMICSTKFIRRKFNHSVCKLARFIVVKFSPGKQKWSSLQKCGTYKLKVGWASTRQSTDTKKW
jgi:hypothetical protein